MRFLRVIFILGYVFFGSFFLWNVGELILRNAWIDLFPIGQTSPQEIDFDMIDENSIHIYYTFEYENKNYEGLRRVVKEIVNERLPEQKDQIIISFNKLFPQVNYLEQLGLKTRSGYVGMSIFGFFLLFFLLIDLFANKRYWLKVYGIPE